MFDTKIAIIIREDLVVWQKLNVTAFLTSGIVGRNVGIIGETYRDAAGNNYNPLIIQPIMIMSASAEKMPTIYRRAMDRGARLSLYIEEMFSTGNDEANRAAVAAANPNDMTIVGMALQDDRKLVDKIIKGLKLHG
jgi:hypothetical protein